MQSYVHFGRPSPQRRFPAPPAGSADGRQSVHLTKQPDTETPQATETKEQNLRTGCFQFNTN